ncbi:YdcF family protein [Aquabacterium sp.]|uniref:YdcF family protein n=1 Tax=Aquabacterium sp. TaxID=1872578 RepID=UPI0037848563
MNQLFVTLGIEAWKPLVNVLALPPLPLLLLALFGGWRLRRQRRFGWPLLLAGLSGLWLSCTTALGVTLIDGLTQPPPALQAAQIQALKGQPHTVVLVLGAGRQVHALDYGQPDVSALTLARLRYGVWLARQTGQPLAYSGGIGYGGDAGPTEAAIARVVAERDFGMTLRWAEDRSRDTNENALHSVALLRAEGIRQIVLVTHGFHQRRALAAFQRAITANAAAITLVPAPVGMLQRNGLRPADWLPTTDGFALTRLALHEWIGRLAGA